MKKFIALLILGCFSIYGFTENPIDPPKKEVEPDKTITPPEQVATARFSESRGLVEVDIHVTFTDCPDYDCEAKEGCAFEVYVYDYDQTPLDHQSFDPEICTYHFYGLRATEGNYPYTRLVPWTSCEHEYNDGWMQGTSVPVGGGDVYVNTYLCQD